MDTLFIFGYGFSSIAIAAACKDQFDQIIGTTRSAGNFAKLEVNEIIPALFDGDTLTPETKEKLNTTTHVLISIAPNEASDKNGDHVLNTCRSALAKNKNLQWIGYLSTVGVYGHHHGAWVNETSECSPVSKRSVERVAAEKSWLDFSAEHTIPLAIFRLSGIYGPGRNAFMNIEKGKARRLVKKNQVFNRIHREDIGAAVSLAIKITATGIFNITDDEPAPPQDVVTLAHALIGKTPPVEIDFETADLTPMARSFYGENKRVSNAKSKRVLGMVYKWPNYQMSLTRMFDEESWKAKP